MQFVRLSVSLFGTIAVVSAVFAAATIWLLLTDPVTVADAVFAQESIGQAASYRQQPYVVRGT